MSFQRSSTPRLATDSSSTSATTPRATTLKTRLWCSASQPSSTGSARSKASHPPPATATGPRSAPPPRQARTAHAGPKPCAPTPRRHTGPASRPCTGRDCRTGWHWYGPRRARHAGHTFARTANGASPHRAHHQPGEQRLRAWRKYRHAQQAHGAPGCIWPGDRRGQSFRRGRPAAPRARPWPTWRPQRPRSRHSAVGAASGGAVSRALSNSSTAPGITRRQPQGQARRGESGHGGELFRPGGGLRNREREFQIGQTRAREERRAH